MDERSFRRAEERMWEDVGVVPSERRIHLRRNDVDVRMQEIGSGPPVLFLHGATNSGASWAFLAGRLASDIRCMLLDRPGCGTSDPLPSTPGVDGLPTHGDTLAVDVLDALGLASAHLVSTSMGGYFAFSSMFRQIGLEEALAAGRVPPSVIDTYIALLRHTDTMANEVAIIGGASLPDLVRRLELSDDVLGRVRAPTLFLWGEQDPFGGPDTARGFAGRIPGAELVLVPGAGHAVWLDDLELAAATVERHLGADRRAVPGASGPRV